MLGVDMSVEVACAYMGMDVVDGPVLCKSGVQFCFPTNILQKRQIQ